MEDYWTVRSWETTWKNFFDANSGKFLQRIWTSPFAEEMSKKTGCVVNFKGNYVQPRNSKDVKSISIRGYCAHENCRSFRLEWIPDNSVLSKKFIIKSTDTEKNHSIQLTRWCNGLVRKKSSCSSHWKLASDNKRKVRVWKIIIIIINCNWNFHSITLLYEFTPPYEVHTKKLITVLYFYVTNNILLFF